MYKAIVVKLTNVREHNNAHSLQLATVCGNQVVVGLDAKDGDIGVYFDVDGALTSHFLSNMNLYRKGDMNADKTKTGMFDDNGRVRAQNLRGEKSEGFWLELENVVSTFGSDVPEGIGAEFDMIGKETICLKYISPTTKRAQGTQSTSKKIKNEMFHQHFDTKQFGRNAALIGLDDVVIITEKFHGTSQRVANVLAPKPLHFWTSLCGWFADGWWLTETNSWTDMIGTRRVILGKDKYKDANSFHPISFRERAAEPFIGRMHKGETFYYEVVGYESEDKLIMGSHGNEKLKKHLKKEDYKSFIDAYGDTTEFTYGCGKGELGIYVYRITTTNEDGYSVDLSWDAVKERCNELEISHVPELYRGTRRQMAAVNQWFDRGTRTPEEYIIDLSNMFIKRLSEGKTTIGHNLSEGVCLRVEKGITPLVLKEKNFDFKVLEGIIKDSGVVDVEEAEG